MINEIFEYRKLHLLVLAIQNDVSSCVLKNANTEHDALFLSTAFMEWLK